MSKSEQPGVGSSCPSGSGRPRRPWRERPKHCSKALISRAPGEEVTTSRRTDSGLDHGHQGTTGGTGPDDFRAELDRRTEAHRPAAVRRGLGCGNQQNDIPAGEKEPRFIGTARVSRMESFTKTSRPVASALRWATFRASAAARRAFAGESAQAAMPGVRGKPFANLLAPFALRRSGKASSAFASDGQRIGDRPGSIVPARFDRPAERPPFELHPERPSSVSRCPLKPSSVISPSSG